MKPIYLLEKQARRRYLTEGKSSVHAILILPQTASSQAHRRISEPSRKPAQMRGFAGKWLDERAANRPADPFSP
jgi:hypothetical protein